LIYLQDLTAGLVLILNRAVLAAILLGAVIVLGVDHGEDTDLVMVIAQDVVDVVDEVGMMTTTMMNGE
jgi:hypothetical protein